MGAEEEVEKEGEEEDVWKKMKIVRDKPLKSNGSSALASYSFLLLCRLKKESTAENYQQKQTQTLITSFL